MKLFQYILATLILITTIGCAEKQAQLIVDQSKEKQRERLELINRLSEQEVFPKVTFADNGPLLFVGPGFSALDVKTITEYVKEIHAYAYREDRGLFPAILRDIKTGSNVGRYHPDTGLTLNH